MVRIEKVHDRIIGVNLTAKQEQDSRDRRLFWDIVGEDGRQIIDDPSVTFDDLARIITKAPDFFLDVLAGEEDVESAADNIHRLKPVRKRRIL